MPLYELTKDAERDLQQIARYTLNKWGKKQLQQYRSGFKQTFNLIATHQVIPRQFSHQYSNLKVIKYQSHFIFYLDKENSKPVIIGVIHQQRDIVKQLARRLGG